MNKKIIMEKNIWPEWESGECESCKEICVNQFLDKYSSIAYLWRASYWKKSVICTCCVDDLTENEIDILNKKEENGGYDGISSYDKLKNEKK